MLRAEGGDSGNTYDGSVGWKVWGYGSGIRGCEIAAGDIDGDGYKNEIAILFFPEQGAGTTYPRLERWYCDRGSITPKRDTDHRKGGSGDTSVLGYTVSHTNSYCMMPEEFSIVAGPLTGTKGKAKLAEDVAISHVNSSRSSVYVIPTKLDSGGNFAGFGDTKTVFNYQDSSEGRRGALITSDFANEVLMPGKPYHTIDDIDTTYLTVLQAIPYHIDNVDVNGQLTNSPINYTFSGFAGDEGNGKMSVTYTRVDEQSTENQVTFNTASTTETISELGDAQGYLKFRATQANIAGNFDERIKMAAEVYNGILDFVTTKIDNVTDSSTKEAQNFITSSKTQALIWDTFVAYTAQQHIWRYKILNNPLPSWYKLGSKADYSSHDIKAENTEHYMTFTLYDTPTRQEIDQDSTNTYQARHEEGNLFSYPSSLEGIDGYNSEAELGDRVWKSWSKGYNEKTTPSELTKTISGAKSVINTIAGWFGADEPFEEENIPDSSTHSETFSNSFANTDLR